MQPLCGAKTRNGGTCKNAAMSNGRCRMHGGKTPRGISSPHFKTGRYSSAMPAELLNKYQEAMADETLLDQRASIATIDALIATILPNLDTADNGKAWVAMRNLAADIRLAYKTENFGRLEKALDEMEDWANLRIRHYETIEETRVLLDTRRKHVETVEKLTLMGERSISSEQMMLLVSQILYTIQAVVTDRQQRNAIATELQKLISVPAGANDTD